MTQNVDYYLSLNSPWTFLGHERVVDIATRAGATLSPIPVDFSIVFPVTGGLPVPKRAPARQAYRMMELRRWRKHLDIALNLEPAHWPANDLLCTGMVTVLCGQADTRTQALALAGAFMRAVWIEDRNIGDEATMLDISANLGLDGHSLLDAAKTGAPEETRKQASLHAIERGVFGAPSFVIGGEVFWGQDRLDFLARALGL